jgi:hypothetical protein
MDPAQHQSNPEDFSSPDEETFPLPNYDPTIEQTDLLPGDELPEVDPEDLNGPTIYGHDLHSDQPAALFVSDLHMSDGDPAGDDFLEWHLMQSPTIPDFIVGNPAAGGTRAFLLARIVQFAIAFVQKQPGYGPQSKLDFVMNGDIIDELELKGRGTPLSPKHTYFRKLCRWLINKGHKPYYIRGNHDPFVRGGPWTIGNLYSNGAITTIAEHGDAYDPLNSPPGYTSIGSRLVIRMAPWEVHKALFNPGAGEFVFSAVDNVRPTTWGTWGAFILSHGLGHPAAAIGYDPADNDLGGMVGTFRPGGKGFAYPGWLVTQGHTHVPVMDPNKFYNTGTWIDTVLFRQGAGVGVQETILRVFPFLIVFRDTAGKRSEHFFTVNVPDSGQAIIARRSRAMINRLRTALGCPPV